MTKKYYFKKTGLPRRLRYDNADNIQVFPLPKHPTIRPPKRYYSEKAEIKQGHLFVVYENGHGKVKPVSYGSI